MVSSISSIYLDYNSTTPVDPQVVEAMFPFFTENYGNPASKTHSFGWIAEEAVEKSREATAKYLNCDAHEVFFTSGATESVNMILKGVFSVSLPQKDHCIIASTEHKAVLDTAIYLEQVGIKVTRLKVNKEGLIDPDDLKREISSKTALVCIMLGNNETGVIQPIETIGKICRENGVYFFSDTTQAPGKAYLNVAEQNIDSCCLSAHKFYGPKGIGAVYLKRKEPRVRIEPLLHGGGHENGLRSGTLNVPGIVGMGKAIEILMEKEWDEKGRLSLMRTRLEQELINLGPFYINGNQKDRLANTTNISFTGFSASDLIGKFPGIALSSGSACSSASPQPSHVLSAMGLDERMIRSSIRFSLGRFTSDQEISEVINQFSTFIKFH